MTFATIIKSTALAGALTLVATSSAFAQNEAAALDCQAASPAPLSCELVDLFDANIKRLVPLPGIEGVLATSPLSGGRLIMNDLTLFGDIELPTVEFEAARIEGSNLIAINAQLAKDIRYADFRTRQSFVLKDVKWEGSFDPETRQWTELDFSASDLSLALADALGRVALDKLSYSFAADASGQAATLENAASMEGVEISIQTIPLEDSGTASGSLKLGNWSWENQQQLTDGASPKGSQSPLVALSDTYELLRGLTDDENPELVVRDALWALFEAWDQPVASSTSKSALSDLRGEMVFSDIEGNDVSFALRFGIDQQTSSQRSEGLDGSDGRQVFETNTSGISLSVGGPSSQTGLVEISYGALEQAGQQSAFDRPRLAKALRAMLDASWTETDSDLGGYFDPENILFSDLISLVRAQGRTAITQTQIDFNYNSLIIDPVATLPLSTSSFVFDTSGDQMKVQVSAEQEGLSIPLYELIPAVRALFPRNLGVDFSFEGLALNVLENDANESGLTLADDPGDMFWTAMSSAPVKLAINRFALNNDEIGIELDGAARLDGVALGGPESFVGKLDVNLDGMDRIIDLVRSYSVFTMGNMEGAAGFSAAIAGLGVAKGFGKQLDDGSLQYEIEIDSEKRQLLINGAELPLPN